MHTSRQPNELIHESSPYLLQHAYNPVHWKTYSEKAFLEAEASDKLVIISIGYSTCHWCHVMEKESFEDEKTAELMNANFVNIKVDREERPDVDALYMQAVQLMTGRGGWPLNVIVLPDKRCIFGGTYFPRDKWNEVLKNIQQLWMHERDKIYAYAENLLAGMKQNALLLHNSESESDSEKLFFKGIEKDPDYYDLIHGGSSNAPKFPMPVNYIFRLHFSSFFENDTLKKHVMDTLYMMGIGGIYDQVGGGFFRYSTDAYWKVPHFEKMLYDNAQLLNLYAKAQRFSPHPEFKHIAHGIYSWLLREMKSPGGGFYAALDADSEGEEGKFYVFSQMDLQEALGEDFELAQEYYEINAEGYWENDNYIPLRSFLNKKDAENVSTYFENLNKLNQTLLQYRNKRIRPHSDTKIICSWNALLVSGLSEYYICEKDEKIRQEAKELIDFILHTFYVDNRLFRSADKKGEATLEDYAAVVSACIDFAAISESPEFYLNKAFEICQRIEDSFEKEENGFLNLVPRSNTDLLTEVYEVQDNVIPSANAIHNHNKLRLAYLFAKPQWEKECLDLCSRVMPSFSKFPMAYSKWADVFLMARQGYTQVVLSGTNAADFRQKEWENSGSYADVFILNHASEIPVFSNRYEENKTRKFVCHGHTCALPVDL